MVGTQILEFIISVITFIFAYSISVTFAGAFRAWANEKLGDDTAAVLGLKSLNPLLHIDLFGLLCFMIAGIGWGYNIPTNTANLTGRFRHLKILAAFFSETIVHIVMAVVAIAALVIGFGADIFKVLIPMVANYDWLSSKFLTDAFPHASSFSIVLSFITISTIYINAMLAAISFLLTSFRYFVNYIFSKYAHNSYTDLLIFLIPLLLILFLATPLRFLLIKIICYLGYWLGSIICPLP